MNAHSVETPEASQPAKVLRCSPFANVHVFDEDDVNDGQTANKHRIASLRRDGVAVSPDDAVEDSDFLKDEIEALLSCPHANPKFLSETQMPGMQISAVALKDLSQSLMIAAPDCIHFLCFSRVNSAN